MSMELDQLHEGHEVSLSGDRDLEGTHRPGTALTRENAQQQRVVTAMRMGSLAAAAHHAAGDLEDQFPQAARHIQDAAAGFERIANLLRDPNLDEVASLIGNLGRRQPAAIVAAVVLVGLGLSWFMTTSRSAGLSAAGEAQEAALGLH
jgi:hypothetical protein